VHVLAKTAKPLTDSKIIKSRIPEVVKVMYPKKVRLYKKISLSVNAAAIIDGISQNVTSHLHKKVSKTDTNTTKNGHLQNARHIYN
jgi:hypothetical protein